MVLSDPLVASSHGVRELGDARAQWRFGLSKTGGFLDPSFTLPYEYDYSVIAFLCIFLIKTMQCLNNVLFVTMVGGKKIEIDNNLSLIHI